jgi:hypothetical protein
MDDIVTSLPYLQASSANKAIEIFRFGRSNRSIIDPRFESIELDLDIFRLPDRDYLALKAVYLPPNPSTIVLVLAINIF